MNKIRFESMTILIDGSGALSASMSDGELTVRAGESQQLCTICGDVARAMLLVDDKPVHRGQERKLRIGDKIGVYLHDHIAQIEIVGVIENVAEKHGVVKISVRGVKSSWGQTSDEFAHLCEDLLEADDMEVRLGKMTWYGEDGWHDVPLLSSAIRLVIDNVFGGRKIAQVAADEIVVKSAIEIAGILEGTREQARRLR